jgi:hypothetical protein
VVLGEPGSGKTMLMVRLVLDLLLARADGEPVPVLASLASWNPAEQGLHNWLASQLSIDPGLAAVPARSRRPSLIAQLLEQRLILPLLDGLDEMPAEARALAIAGISSALRPGEAVVVTCRATEYREAARRTVNMLGTIRAAAVIQLCPLEPRMVSDYLVRDAGGPGAAARWGPVLATLGTTEPTGHALLTPLMVGLARVIYNPRPGETVVDPPEPAELRRLPDRAAVEAHLFNAFIPACYRHATGGRWDLRQVQTWLVFLARHLEHTIQGPDLAWWQLRRSARPGLVALAAGLLLGLVAGVVIGLLLAVEGHRTVVAGLGNGLGVRLAAGLEIGVFLGLLFALFLTISAVRAQIVEPSRGLRVSIAGLTILLIIMLALGLPFGLQAGLRYGLGQGLLAGLAVPSLIAPIFGLGIVRRVPGVITSSASPAVVLRRDRHAAFIVIIGYSSTIGLTVGLATGLMARQVGSRLVAGLIFGLFFGLLVMAIGLLWSAFQSAWPAYLLSRSWLAMHHRLPWSLMDFLADAHQRGILRQVGSLYQFRHIDLQRRLADRPRELWS